MFFIKIERIDSVLMTCLNIFQNQYKDQIMEAISPGRTSPVDGALASPSDLERYSRYCSL